MRSKVIKISAAVATFITLCVVGALWFLNRESSFDFDGE